jgi:tRNA pseudouridine38-40 synthase
MDALRDRAALLLGKHDFRSFCSNKRYKKSTVRTVTRLELEDLGPELRMTFEGDGFLYHMVRILAGTLAEVGMGERSADSMPALLSALDREQAGRTLPARGLILDEVFYH